MGARDLVFTVHVETAKVYKVRSVQPRKTDWANATIRSWPGGGSIDVQSDYGSYAHSWTAIGDRPFLKFLIGLDYDYFMTKARGDYRQFDAEGSVKRIKEYILEARRDGSLTKDRARDLFSEADEYDTYWQTTEEGLGSQLSAAMWDFIGGDFPTKTRDNPETRGFWDRVWPMLVHSWREDLQKPLPVAA